MIERGASSPAVRSPPRSDEEDRPPDLTAPLPIHHSTPLAAIESASTRAHATPKRDHSHFATDPPVSSSTYMRDGDEDEEDEDVAPVNQSPALARQRDHEPFQVLARHLSGRSTPRGVHPHPTTESSEVLNPATSAAVEEKLRKELPPGEQKRLDRVAKLLTPGGGFKPPPDGGLEAWGVIVGAWFILFVQFGIITSFGSFESYYRENQLSTYSHSTIAWIGSLSVFACFFGSIFSGRWFDGHGARVVVWGGTLVSVISLYCLAFCKVFYQFLLAHLLFGIASAALYSPCSAVVSHWFLRRRSLCIGIILCGSGLGGVIFPIILSRLFPRIGFRNTVLVVASMAVVLFSPAWFTVKARLPPKKAIPWKEARLPWRETNYTVYCLGVALLWMNYFTPFFFANDFAASQGVPTNLASYSVAILQAGSFLGRALSGPSAEYFGAIESFVTNGVLSGLVILALWTSRAVGTVGTIIGLFLYGLFSGVVIALVAACCAQLSPVREFGLRLGMMWTVASIPLLAGPQLAGLLVEREDGYTGAMIFSGVTIVAGSMVTFAPVLWERAKVRFARGKGAREDEGEKAV